MTQASSPGIAIISVGTSTDSAATVVLQPDGKSVVAGFSLSVGSGTYDFAVCRRNVDGTLDPTFGAGTGQVVVPVGTGDDYAYSAVMQPDGKILVAGYSYSASRAANDFSVIRLDSTGNLDTSFGNGTAKVTLPINSTGTAYSVAVQNNGLIVVAGYSFSATGSTGDDFSVVRLDASGNLDTAFGAGTGKVVLQLASGYDFGRSALIQSDGKIVISGTFGGGDFGVARLNTNGTLDAGFGATGYARVAVGTFGVASAYGAALQSDGKILVVGLAHNEATGKKSFAVVRLSTDGSVDSGFGAMGRVFIPFGDMDSGRSVLVQPDGMIVVAGYTRFDPSPLVTATTVIAVARMHPDGTLDSSFGQSGKATFAVGSSNAYGYGLALQPDGKILVAGQGASTNAQTGEDFALLRLTVNGGLDTGFGAAVTTSVTGTGGDDFFTSGVSDSHTFDGGAGSDGVVYTNATGPVVADLLAGSATWSAGSDTLISIEKLFGSAFNDTLTGNAFENYLVGGGGNDSLVGGGGGDRLSGDAGNDFIDGGAGIDVVSYAHNRSSCTLTFGVHGNVVVNGPDGVDTLTANERLQFADKKVAIDLLANQNGGQSLDFIGALAYPLVKDPGAIGVILSLFDSGKTMIEISQMAIDVGLVRQFAGSNSNTDLAKLVFRNVIGGEGDTTVIDMLVGFMDGRSANYSQAEFLATVANLEVNQQHVGLVGLQVTGVEYL